jgi:hypothetical protein
MTRPAIALVLALTLLATVAGPGSAQVPQKMDYQVMLTDAANQPLADQFVALVFGIYTASSGGSQIWTETQVVTTNSIGVVSVVLGSVNPLTIEFTAPRWLQVEVNGEVMTPRRELVAAPYARQADNADNLGGTAAGSFALSSTLSTAGTINAPGNPVDWTKLKSVPAGFADGTDNAGLGDGNSLDAPDGDPQDAIYVEAGGDVVVNEPTTHSARLKIRSEGNTRGLCVVSDSYSTFGAGIFAIANSASGIVGNVHSDLSTISVPSIPTGVAGIAYGSANGVYAGAINGVGAYCETAGSGAAVMAEAFGSGYSGHFLGGLGVRVGRAGGYPVLQAHNTATTGWGDAAWFISSPGMNSGTWTMNAACYEGNAGRFLKNTDDDNYALLALGDGGTGEALYVQGSSHFTMVPTYGVATSRGTEAVFSVAAPDVEIMTSGTASLAGGTARVEFDRLFAESVSDAVALRVTATPVGAWSALYLAQVDGGGFTVRSDAGDANASFNWVAVGRAKGYDERPAVSIPDPAEDARVAAEKKAAVEAARPPERPEGPGTVTLTAGE